MGRREMIAAWRKAIVKFKDPHYAVAATTLKPTMIAFDLFGHHISVCFKEGVRTYAFNGQANRDRFVNQYRPHGASPVGDPLASLRGNSS